MSQRKQNVTFSSLNYVFKKTKCNHNNRYNLNLFRNKKFDNLLEFYF